MVPVDAALGDTVPGLIRTRADVSRLGAANAHDRQMHEAVEVLRRRPAVDGARLDGPAVVEVVVRQRGSLIVASPAFRLTCTPAITDPRRTGTAPSRNRVLVAASGPDCPQVVPDFMSASHMRPACNVGTEQDMPWPGPTFRKPTGPTQRTGRAHSDTPVA